MWPRQLVVFGVFIAALSFALGVTHRAQASEPPSRISVLTMGPGDHPFTRFGHNALLLEWDGARRRSLVYNFGTFEFDGLTGVKDFMAGRFRYWLSVSTLDATVRAYGAARRDLTAQQLSLSEKERAELFDALAANARPEQRFYDYDYYLDNCSTRVRDALDRTLGGQLRREIVGPGELSFREHTLALVQTSPWLYLGLDLALGAPTDRPTTRWQELFLPQRLHDELGRRQRELDGAIVPLVSQERRLLQGAPRPLPQASPRQAGLFGAALLGAGLAVLGLGAARRAAWRALFGVVTSVGGAAIGLLGTALWIFSSTKHWAAHENASWLACPPWALALGVLGVLLSLGRDVRRPLCGVLGASLLTTVVLLALSAGQRSGVVFLPLWAGWLYGAWQASATAHAIADSGGGTLLDVRGAATTPDVDSGEGVDSRSSSG